MRDAISSQFCQPIEFDLAAPGEELSRLSAFSPYRLRTPSQYLQAALDQRRKELEDEGYHPCHAGGDVSKDPFIAREFEEVFNGLARYIERPAPGNLAALLNPQNWNPAVLLDPGRRARKPRLGISTNVTRGGHLYTGFFFPAGEGARRPEDFDQILSGFSVGSSWGSPEPEELLRVRGFDALSIYGARGPAREYYRRSVKLLVLACHAYIEWVVEASAATLEIVREDALFIDLVDGTDGEQEIAGVEIRNVPELERQERRAQAEAARRAVLAWRNELPAKVGFSAEQAVGAFQRSGGNYAKAHRIILEVVTDDSIKKPTYAQFKGVVEKLRANFPELFNQA